MISQVINRRNMHLAFKYVLRNKGSAGVDGMQVRELKGYIGKHIPSIALSITKGNYLPQPILGKPYPRAMERPGYWVFPLLLTGGCSKLLNNHHSVV